MTQINLFSSKSSSKVLTASNGKILPTTQIGDSNRNILLNFIFNGTNQRGKFLNSQTIKRKSLALKVCIILLRVFFGLKKLRQTYQRLKF